jgi:hypothetical protein
MREGGWWPSRNNCNHVLNRNEKFIWILFVPLLFFLWIWALTSCWVVRCLWRFYFEGWSLVLYHFYSFQATIPHCLCPILVHPRSTASRLFCSLWICSPPLGFNLYRSWAVGHATEKSSRLGRHFLQCYSSILFLLRWFSLVQHRDLSCPAVVAIGLWFLGWFHDLGVPAWGSMAWVVLPPSFTSPMSSCFGSAMRQGYMSIPMSSSSGCSRPATWLNLRS